MNDLTIDYFWNLMGFEPNNNQREAILHIDGPLFLPAGPGSGKTRVLLWRTLNLIVFHGIKPDEIYLSTFTEKAAHQLKDGIRLLLSIVTNRTGRPYDISRMYVGTIHSLCNKIITDRRFSGDRRRHEQPSLLDDIDQYFYLSRKTRWRNLTDSVGLGNGNEEINVTINDYFDSSSHSRHQAIVNCIALFNRFSEEHIDPNIAINKTNDEELIGLLRMYQRYLGTLATERNVPRMDFSLMQQEALKILQAHKDSENVFKHVIIDEYQDTNPIQEQLIFKLGSGSKNICVVGDDDQALYRFRGATVENFVNFPEKCIQILGQEPNFIPLDINYRSRKCIVSFYMDFIDRWDWSREDNPNLKHRIPKNIQAHRQDELPSVVASTPNHPDVVCPQIANFVKALLDSNKVENENQIAFLFPSLKSVQVTRLREALEQLGLKVYAPRAGSFLKVDESVSIFGIFLRIFGKIVQGHYPGHDYQEYMQWVDQACNVADDLIQDDPQLNQFIEDTKLEIKIAKQDYTFLKTTIDQQGWSLEQPYDLNVMKSILYDIPGISDHARRNIKNGYFDRVVKQRQFTNQPVALSYLLTRSTSLDWNLLDLFYRLCSFDHFKVMFDLAESGMDEGPICNLSLISQYLARFMDLYRPVISADVLLEDRYANWLFGSYLYALFRLGESEYENPEDPFPKGRIPFLTIHQAKGLEFPVVVFGNPNKSRRGVQKVEEIIHPLIERQSEPLNKMPDFDMMRLFYVALSRAKNLLIIPHWSSQGNYVSEPLRSLLDSDHVVRIPEFDLTSLPEAKLEKDDLPKNYSYTADYLLYKKCPRQYMIFRKYGFVPSRSQTMFFGNLVHHTLEDLHHHLIAERLLV